MAEKKNLHVTIFRSYDLLFLGYYEYAFRSLAEQGNITLKITGPKHAKLNYSPRETGFRGQFYFETSHKDLGIRKCIVDISDGYDDIRLPLLNDVDIYYKCHYSSDYIEGLDIDEKLKYKIRPASIFFPLQYLNKLEYAQYFYQSFFEMVGFDKNSTFKNDFMRWKTNVNRARQLPVRPTMERFNLLSKNNGTGVDIFYSASTWPGLDEKLTEERAALIRTLKNMTSDGVNVHAEFLYNAQVKNIYPDLMIDYKRPFSEYYQLLSSAKIVVLHKSLSGGALSWRLGEALAMGKVYIHEHTPNNLYIDKLLDPQYGVFYDSQDLKDKLLHILNTPELYAKMKNESELKFKKYFAPVPTARYLINTLYGDAALV